MVAGASSRPHYGSGMDFIPTLALGLLVYTIINFLRYATNREWHGVGTIASAWVAGVIGVILAAQTDFASGISVGDESLATLNLWSLVFVGLTVASTGSAFSDALGAVDTTRTTAKPPLL